MKMVLVACLISNMSTCKEVDIRDEQQSFLLQCIKAGQQTAAKWSNEHPNWKVVKIRCEPDLQKT